MAVKNITDLHVLGNVGIGTTSPAEELHVVGDTRTSRLIITDTGGVGRLTLDIDANEDTILTTGTTTGTRSLLFLTETAERMRIDSSGNVGIGTTSPQTKLHVNAGSARIDGGTYNLTVDHGAGSGSAGVVLQSTGSNLPFVRWTDGTNINAGIRATSAKALKFQTNGFNDRMTIDSSGNVGIGTTSPVAALHVQSSSTKLFLSNTDYNNATSTGSGMILQTGASSGNTYGMIYSFQAGNTSYANLVVPGGNVGIGTTNMYARLNVRATSHNNGISVNRQADNTAAIYIGNDGGSNPVLAANNADMLFGRDLSGTFTERMRLTNSGSLGIGTTSPGYKIHSHSSGINNYMQITSATTGSSQSDGFLIGTGDSGDALLLNRENTPFRFFTNNTERMRITEGGNVGIGTTSPGAKLEVVGDTYLRTQLFTDTIRPYSADQLTLLNGNNNYLYVNGKVGIGTASPSGKLHIKPDASSEFIFTGASTSGYATTFHMDNTGLDIGHNSTSRALNLKTGSLDRLTILGNGNVGIGTTSPGYTLDVNGSMHSTNITIADAVYHEGDTNTYISFGTDTINLNTGGGTRAIINNSGAKFNNDVVVAGGAALSLGERAEPDDLGRTVLIEGAANASNGEGAGRIFFTEHNSTTAGADSYGLSLYYEGDPNIALPSGFQPNQGNATWALRRHDNSVNGVPIMSGSRSNSNVQFGGSITLGSGVTLSESTGRADLLSINSSTGGWGGLQITNTSGEGIWSFMVDNDAAGIYDDQNGDWAVYCVENSYVQLRHNNSGKLTTTSTGVDVTGTLNALGGTVRSQYDGSNYSQLESNASGGVFKALAAGATNILLRSYGESYFNGGNVGIGTTSPSEKLEVSGNILASGDITAFSDANLKENVETVSDALDKVKGMRGVTFNKIGEEKRSVGVIAQELLEVLPEAVRKSGEHYSVAYGNIVGVLIEAMKEQQAQIDELKAMINGLTK